MVLRTSALLLLAICLGIAGASSRTVAQPDSPATQPAEQATLLNDIQSQGYARVIVTFAAPDSAQSGRSARRNSIAAAQSAILTGVSAADFNVTHRFRNIPAMAGTVSLAGLQALQNNPMVRAVGPDYPIYAQNLEARQLVNADDVASTYGLDGTGITVAVLDTGVDTDHPDLAAAIVDQRCFLVGGGCPGGGTTGTSAEDGAGHGSHVSGTILGRGNDAGGAEGGFAPGASLVAIKVLNDAGSGSTTDSVNAFDYLIDNHPDIDIVNMSLGGSTLVSAHCDTSNATNIALKAAIDELGAIVFAASGNAANATGISSPACLSNTIAVGAVYSANFGGISWSACTDATTAADKITCFSNAAPILDILSPGALLSSTVPGGGYDDFGGTSMATPAAAGVGALLLEADPTLTRATMLSVLKSTGVSILDTRNGISFKRINALAAVIEVAVPETPTGLTATGISQTQIDVSWDDVDGETGYALESSSDGVSGWIEIIALPSNVTTYSHTTLICDTDYYYRVIALNGDFESDPSATADATTDICGVQSELLVNGNFDDNDAAPAKIPDDWNASGPLKGDKVRVDGASTTSHSAPNTFQFMGYTGEKNSKIAQSVNLLVHGFDVGDTLILSAFVDQRTGKPNALIGQVVIMYNDDTPNTKVKLKLPAVKTVGYVKLEANPIILSNADIKKVSVQLLYNAPTGKFYIDDVSLMLTEPIVLGASGGLVPLPAAPGDLRGQ